MAEDENTQLLIVMLPTLKHGAFKAACAESGRSMREVVESLIDVALEVHRTRRAVLVEPTR